MDEKRTLIETFLPVEEISTEAKKEKNGRAPIFELHYWWTRKPLVAARSTVLGTVLPSDFDIDEFKSMLGLRDNQKQRAHNYVLKESQLNKIKKNSQKLWNSENPTIFDPFAGGGSIPFEALRSGCNVISNDYNPLSCMIQKATFEYPLKYGNKLLYDVEKGIDWIFNESKNNLKDFYPKHDQKEVAFYIYCWIVSCPDCHFKNPLVGQWWLVRKKEKKLFLKPSIKGNKLVLKIQSGNKAPEGTVTRGKGKCLKCGSIIPKDHIKKEIYEKEEEKLLSVVLNTKGGKEYELPSDSDLDAIKNANEFLDAEKDLYLKEDLIPMEEMPDDLRGGIWAKLYLKYWYKILNPRQRILFANLIRLIRDYSGILEKKYDDKEYVIAVSVCIALLLGKHVNRNCRSTKYDRGYEKISGTTSLRGIAINWDHTEVNPFVKASGSLLSAKNTILKSLKYSIEKLHNNNYNNNLIITNDSILNLKSKAQIIVTDPPYFDDVQYAELSELFYVFEKRALKNLIKLPSETPKSEDLSVGGKRNNEVFENLFKHSCDKLNSMLSDNGIIVMYFAHSSIEAWDFVVNSLKNSKFRITATWPIHTENPNNPLAKGNASIMSSIVIVARKRKKEKSGYIEEIKGELEIHLKNRLKEFWSYGLRGADITVAAMGATLDILTQYSEIKSYTGEMTIKDILELVEVYVVEYILEKFLMNSESLDSPSRFYIYCRLSQLDGMSFDTANLISKSLHINLKILESSGLIRSITGGRNKGIKILKFNERENIEIKNLIDAVQLSLLAYERGGFKEFEKFIIDIPYTQGEIFNILESFKHLESGDSEKKIAMQIMGKSDKLIPEKGQSTFE